MNNLTTDKCKEQFEKWLKSTGQNPPYATKRGYWEIWKASREAVEIAPPILEQQGRGEGVWIEWKGGECPTDESGRLDLKLRNGHITPGVPAGCVDDWGHKGLMTDIIAYRIIATNQNGEQS